MNAPIPRRLHYCWFGGKPKPPKVLACMESWRRVLPDWEIVEWNEGNADLSRSAFARAMLERRRWAFVSDYVRARAVLLGGGVYLDTDVEILASLEPFLGHRAFTGFETRRAPFTAVFGAEPGHPWVAAMARLYEETAPPPPEADLATWTNTRLVTGLLLRDYGVRLDDSRQELPEGLVLYPSHYFCYRRAFRKSYALHHMEGSWTSGRGAAPKRALRALIGPRLYRELAEASFSLRHRGGREGA